MFNIVAPDQDQPAPTVEGRHLDNGDSALTAGLHSLDRKTETSASGKRRQQADQTQNKDKCQSETKIICDVHYELSPSSSPLPAVLA